MYKVQYCFILLVFLLGSSITMAQKKIVTMKIDDVIDPRMNRYTELALDFAEEEEADIVIVEMDT